MTASLLFFTSRSSNARFAVSSRPLALIHGPMTNPM